MIEINLLPQEYRVQERTPLGLFLTIVVGIVAVSCAVFWYIDVSQKLRQARDTNAQLQQDLVRWQDKKKQLDAIKAEIAIKQKRQQTIINISESKIMWSQKLCQLGKILSDYPLFWVDRLSVSRGSIDTTFYCVSETLDKVAEFREAVMADTSFWYHFRGFEAYNYQFTKPASVKSATGGAVAIPCMITFSTRWPIR